MEILVLAYFQDNCQNEMIFYTKSAYNRTRYIMGMHSVWELVIISAWSMKLELNLEVWEGICEMDEKETCILGTKNSVFKDRGEYGQEVQHGSTSAGWMGVGWQQVEKGWSWAWTYARATSWRALYTTLGHLDNTFVFKTSEVFWRFISVQRVTASSRLSSTISLKRELRANTTLIFMALSLQSYPRAQSRKVR